MALEPGQGMGGNGGDLSGVTLVWPPLGWGEESLGAWEGLGHPVPAPGRLPRASSLPAASQAAGTCGQSPYRRTGSTVPRRRSVHSGKSKFGSQCSLGRTTGRGTLHTTSGHRWWEIQKMEPSVSAGPWL